ncbi:hypothetical protein [Streptomyces venezuelae]|uniref:hypothetical protein n=1 Tax=Streptomyces venezuelae TaxID=54571 RepID=UPI001238A778|nr:hypothetical protein [Streptomyces venezuelae]
MIVEAKTMKRERMGSSVCARRIALSLHRLIAASPHAYTTSHQDAAAGDRGDVGAVPVLSDSDAQFVCLLFGEHAGGARSDGLFAGCDRLARAARRQDAGGRDQGDGPDGGAGRARAIKTLFSLLQG